MSLFRKIFRYGHHKGVENPFPARASLELNPDMISRYYDEWTSRYETDFGDTLQACRTTEIERLHDYLLKSIGLEDGQKVLDAGCGVCGPGMYFAGKLDIHIEALTISRIQVDKSSGYIKDKGLSDRIKVTQGDFHCLAGLYPENSFDVAYFLESFSHSTHPDDLVSSVATVLKPGGILYIKDFFRRITDDRHEQDRIDQVVANVNHAFRVLTPDRLDTVKLLKKHGFREIFSRDVQFDIDDKVWQNFDHRHKFDLYRGVGPCVWSEWLEMKFQKP